jgi:hypothetical protein
MNSGNSSGGEGGIREARREEENERQVKEKRGCLENPRRPQPICLFRPCYKELLTCLFPIREAPNRLS